ncbi:hypothetical protein [Demequina mangrovi]|uniref:SurA N-terminal domain-containing protein n=1 Tax=Demequina mangrovi TaxID=1043493 RepID=A0A1H6Y475_9MICO|nr:hypothetical protein [Demequina mangrovi]SEJ36079.1 hypothetical protein SAMN05421637_1560 [Demequina mangrovi]
MRSVRLAVLAASSLLLAGCAVPGQGGDPGVALETADVKVTTAELDAIAAAWAEDSEGVLMPDRQALATSTLLGPSLIDFATANDATINEGVAATFASEWLRYAGVEDPEPSDAVIASTQNVLALYVATYTDTSGSILRNAVEDLPEDLVVSPRLGELSADALIESAQTAVGDAEVGGLGNYSFTLFLDVDGFTEPSPSWAARD